MCFNCDNLASVLKPSGIHLTRRHFTRGLCGAAALAGLLPLGGVSTPGKARAQTTTPPLPESVRQVHAAIDDDAPVMVAQPAEELGEGARAMVRDGLYSQGVPKPDFLVGLHTVPIPTGLAISQPGDLNAGTDQLDVTFYGVGGHGSSPHLAKDPVLMAALAGGARIRAA